MEPLQAGTYYHIYNRANGSENLFREPENYRYFLQQWNKYITPVASTIAYCLMPNHFHFLIIIKEEKELEDFFNKKLSKGSQPLESFIEKEFNRHISLQFSHLFNAYAQAFNKMFQRKGSLFMSNFKKKKIQPINARACTSQRKLIFIPAPRATFPHRWQPHTPSPPL